MKDVLYFEPSDSWDDGCYFAKMEDGRLAVSVSEEKAVDSYNQMFECTMHLTPEQVEELRNWLNSMFPSIRA